MIRIAIFDDNAARREGLRFLIDSKENMQHVGSYEDCRNAAAHVDEVKPDVVLMDINMPYVDGIEGLKEIKATHPGVKIIMQTVFEDEDKIINAICAGADGYILKQKSPDKLLDGILDVMEEGSPMTPTVANKVLKFFNSQQLNKKESEVKLTKRESEIMALLVEGYSYKMIAAKCFVSYATVNKHISNIYSKLQVNSVAAAVSKALREGLV